MQQAVDLFDVAFAVLVGDAETVVVEDLLQHAAQVAARAVQAGVRVTRAGAQRRPGGVHEHGAVADAVVAEQPTEDRVEPGFRQFVVGARIDQGDVGALRHRPALHIDQIDPRQRLGKLADGGGDPFLIKVDAFGGGTLGLLPLRLLEALAGALGDLLEALAIVVEALQDELGDLGSRPVRGHGESPDVVCSEISQRRGRGKAPIRRNGHFESQLRVARRGRRSNLSRSHRQEASR
ncbi:hypothetical protein D9M71_176960 [compost metagenome]